jgi:RNA polymerase subunit RPABC4/transcription elongation factor Spt4
MNQSTHCHACRKEVEETPRVCPHCGAPNPTLAYGVTKPIVVAVAIVIVLSVIADVFHSRKPLYVKGHTYPIAKKGVVCLTLNGLAKAKNATPEEAERLGCLSLAPDRQSQVKFIEKDKAAVRVIVLAPNRRANNFQGWTAAENLSLDPADTP